eukprot:1611_1
MACDYRIMAKGDGTKGRGYTPTIGMNETRLGIAAPYWMGQMLVRTIGCRNAELALAMGTMFSPDEALRIGLVDDVVVSSQDSSSEEAGGSEEEERDDIVDALLRGMLLPPILEDQA